LNWDLTSGNAITRVGWAQPGSDSTTLKQPELHILLPFGRRYDGVAEEAVLTRKGEALTTVVIRSAPRTLAEVHAAGLAQAKAWAIDTGPIEDWLAKRKTEAPPDTAKQFRAFSREGEPALLIESRASGDSARPWVLSITLTWLKPR
jgi:hypothetical protein